VGAERDGSRGLTADPLKKKKKIKKLQKKILWR
jgi:hypothetical protein